MTRATVLEPRSSNLRHSCSCTRVLDAGGPAVVETPGLPRGFLDTNAVDVYLGTWAATAYHEGLSAFAFRSLRWPQAAAPLDPLAGAVAAGTGATALGRW